MKRLIAKLASTLPALALAVGIFAANSACSSFFHQTEVPSAMDAFRK